MSRMEFALYFAIVLLGLILAMLANVLPNWIQIPRPKPGWIKEHRILVYVMVGAVILASAGILVLQDYLRPSEGKPADTGHPAGPPAGGSPGATGTASPQATPVGPGNRLVTAEGKCVFARNGSSGYNQQIVTGPCGDPGNQRWWLLPTTAPGVFRLVNDVNRCLGAKDVYSVY